MPSRTWHAKPYCDIFDERAQENRTSRHLAMTGGRGVQNRSLLCREPSGIETFQHPHTQSGLPLPLAVWVYVRPSSIVPGLIRGANVCGLTEIYYMMRLTAASQSCTRLVNQMLSQIRGVSSLVPSKGTQLSEPKSVRAARHKDAVRPLINPQASNLGCCLSVSTGRQLSYPRREQR